MAVTWNSFLGAPLSDAERALVAAACEQSVQGPLDSATDGVGLDEGQLAAMRWAIVRAQVDAPGIDRYALSDRATEAAGAFAAATQCRVGSHGGSRTEPSVVVNARIPESVVARMDASDMGRSGCVRVALAYAANAGVI